MPLVCIRFIRHLIGLQDEFYIRHLTEKDALGPILDVLIETLPRDNLLSSASLELFEFIKKENIKELVKHLVANFRERLVSLSYMPTFRDIVLRYDQTQGYTANMDYFLEGEDDLGRKPPPNTRLMEQITVDPAEEEYWNTSDPEDEDEDHHEGPAGKTSSTNGAATPSRPLVDYPSDEESDENANPEAEGTPKGDDDSASGRTGPSQDLEMNPVPPLERLSEKRQREEDEEDELGRLMQNKRRSSSSGSNASTTSRMTPRRKSFSPNSGHGGHKKISISLSSTVKTGGSTRSDEQP